MTKNIAKKCIDYIFQQYHNTIKIVGLNFIGGEPLLNLPIIDFICSYFLQKCCELKSPWIHTCHFAFISNGLLADTEKVYNFLKKYEDYLAFTISLDGPAEIHNKCRITKEGLPTFELAYKNWQKLRQDFPTCVDIETKATIAPENLSQLHTIVDFFASAGFKVVHINCIQEHLWTYSEAKIYYKELKQIADKLSNLKLKIDLFNPKNYQPKSFDDNDNFCGGLSRNSITFTPDGEIYTCIRFTSTSLGEKRLALPIGNVEEGITNTVLYNYMMTVNRRSQSNDECFYCPIAEGCGWCSAYNYEITGDINKRNTNICVMHQAEALANAYYYKTPLYLPKEKALKIITEEEYAQFHIAGS